MKEEWAELLYLWLSEHLSGLALRAFSCTNRILFFQFEFRHGTSPTLICTNDISFCRVNSIHINLYKRDSFLSRCVTCILYECNPLRQYVCFSQACQCSLLHRVTIVILLIIRATGAVSLSRGCVPIRGAESFETCRQQTSRRPLTERWALANQHLCTDTPP